jgi:cell division protein FtsQ
MKSPAGSSTAPRRNRRIASSRQRRDQHLLDVKVRSRKAAQQRNRKILAWISVLILVVGTAVGAWYGSREALRRFFWQNPEYNLTEIEIKTDGPLSREQVMDATGLREGVNIFGVDISDVRKGLMALAQVEHAEVERELPNKLSIQISERKPVAWVAEKSQEDPTVSPTSFLVDRKGVLMRPRTQTEEYLRMPVIYGVPVENFEPGESVDTMELRAALELLRLTADNPTRFQVKSVDLSKGYCMIASDQNRAKITFGLDHVDQQLERLNILLDSIESSKREIQTVNLLVQRNVPVTFMPPPDVENSDEAQLPAAKPTPSASPASAAKSAAALKAAFQKTQTTSAKTSSAKRANSLSKRKSEFSKPVRRAVAVSR